MTMANSYSVEVTTSTEYYLLSILFVQPLALATHPSVSDLGFKLKNIVQLYSIYTHAMYISRNPFPSDTMEAVYVANGMVEMTLFSV